MMCLKECYTRGDSMKKYLWFAALIFMLGAVTGCNTEKANVPQNTDNTPAEATVDYTIEYKDVLESIYETAANAYNTDEPEQGCAGIWEAALALEDEALSQIGYVLKDINGDNIPELLVGAFDKEEYAYTNNELYAVYTLKNGDPVFVLDGRSRSSYSLKDDGSLFYQGSNGAAYSIFGLYRISAQGDLVCDDYYFTYPDDNDPSIIEIYHNNTGIYVRDDSEKLDITLDDLCALQEDAAKGTVKLTATPFAKLDIAIIEKQ